MKSFEKAIVTVRIGRDEMDMELPTFMPIGELAEKILEILQLAQPIRYGRMRRIVMRCNGNRLPLDQTLAQCGVWEGSILDCRVE